MTERLSVDADLRLEVGVDGAPSVHALVTGDGDRLRVVADHPLHLLRAAASLRDAAAPQGDVARQVGSALGDAGLTVTLAGPHRDLLHVGAGRPVVRPARPVVIAALAVAALISAAVAVVVRRGGSA